MSSVTYVKYRTADGAILGRTTVATGTELPNTAGIGRLEGGADEDLKMLKVDLQTMTLVPRPALPVTVADPQEVFGGWEVAMTFPAMTQVWFEFDNSSVELADGHLTVEFDGPGSYPFIANHPLHLEHSGVIEIPDA
jgi:hypothetical protein